MCTAATGCLGCAVDGEDNFAPLAAIGWQVHVYGTPRAELVAWCAARSMPLHVFNWRPEHEAAGLARDAIYLLRPDTYVALADRSGAPADARTIQRGSGDRLRCRGRLNREASGFHPEPHQEALPPGPPPRAVPLETHSFWLGVGGGPTRTLKGLGRPPPTPNQLTDCKGRCLCWGSKGQSPSRVRGRSPRASRFKRWRR